MTNQMYTDTLIIIIYMYSFLGTNCNYIYIIK